MPLCLQWARRRETRYHEAAERREQTTSGMAFQRTRVAAGPFTEHTTYIQKDVFDKLHTKFTTAPACATQRRSVTSPWHGPCDLRLSHRRHALLVPFALRLFHYNYAPKRDPPPASRLPPPEHLCFQLFLASNCFCQPRYRCPKPLQPFTDCHSSLRYYWLPSATRRSPAYADELHPSQGRNKAPSVSDRPAYLGSISAAPSSRSYMCMFLIEPFREYPKAVGELLSYYTGRSLKTRGHELLVHICIHTYIYMCVCSFAL